MADVAHGGNPAPEPPPSSGTPDPGPTSGVPSADPAALASAVAVAGHAVPTSGPAFGGSASPASPTSGRRSGKRRWLMLGGMIVFFAACSVAMLFILGRSNGPTGLAVGLAAAILPVPILASAFLWLDRYEPEPVRFLVFCFGWGAVVATLVAIGVNTGMAYLFSQWGLPDALVAVLVAPFIEESMKALGPILLFWRRRREWSGITDGIVYCGLSALGFAMVENVLYLGGHGYAAGADQYGPASGIQNLFLIFIVRILFTGFAHPLFTSMTGIGLGVAARSGDRRVRWLAPLAGLLLAMILHGTFNLLPTLSVATGETVIMLYGYLGFMVPFFFIAVGFAISLRGYEGRLTERILPRYVRTGWLTPPEVATLGTLGRRHSARQWARRVAGEPGLRAMKGFQLASTQLALLRDGMERGLTGDPQSLHRAQEEEQKLLTDISGYRAQFVGRDPQTPQAFWDGHAYRITFPDGITRPVPAPNDPVVPIPVRLAASLAYAGHGAPGYGGGAAGYGAPGYGGGAAGHGAPGYGGRAAGHGAPGYGGAAGYGAPGYGGAAGYGAPGFGGAGYGVSGFGGAGHGAPGVGAAGYGAPGFDSAGYGAPGYGASGHGAPGYGGAAGYGAPGYGGAGHGAPGFGASGYGAPGHGTPGHGVSGYGAPGQGAYGGPEQSGSPYAAPGHAAPGHGAPGSGAPGYGAGPGGFAYDTPGNDTSGNGAPGYGAPGYGASGYGAPGSGGSGYGGPGFDTPGNGGPSSGASGSGGPGYGGAFADTPGNGGPSSGASGFGAPGYGGSSAGGAAYGGLQPGASSGGQQAPDHEAGDGGPQEVRPPYSQNWGEPPRG